MFNSKKKFCGNRKLSHVQKKKIKERILKPHELQEYKGVHNIEDVGSLDTSPVTSSPTPEAEPSTSLHRLPESSCSPSPAGPCSVSFESLLLQKIAKNPTSSKKRTKVKSQLAEIVTRDQVLETLTKETPKTKTRRTKNSDSENSEDNFSVHDSNSSDGSYVEEEE